MIIESHAHYSYHKFDQAFRCLCYKNGEFAVEESNREKLIADLMEEGIAACVEPAIGIETNEKIYRLSCRYPGYILPAYGCHPTRTFLTKWKQRKVIDRYAVGECVAIGETGLDYHYKRRKQHRLCQKMWFSYQIRLAHKLRKPMILHIRKASADALKMLKRHEKRLHGGVVHCFNDDYQTAQAYIDLGLHIGIGGALLTKEHAETLTEVIRRIPLERIVVETDAPYVLPDIPEVNTKKYRVRNSSTIIRPVLERIAQIKGMDVSEAEAKIHENTCKLFSLNGNSG